MSKKLFSKVFILLLVVGLLFAVAPTGQAQAQTGTTIQVGVLYPSWTAPGGGGVWASYTGPEEGDTYEDPGDTNSYDGFEAGIIKAGLKAATDGHYRDQGLLAFKVDVTIADFAGHAFKYVVQNEKGSNPVWVRIRISGTSTTYQYVPTSYGVGGGYHTIDAAAGQWQLMTEGGVGTGSLMSLTELANSLPSGTKLDRIYLTLGMGDSYRGSGDGTIAWVDKVVIDTVTYDFVVIPTTSCSTACYVDAAYGDDTFPGTAEFPKKTIQDGIDRVIPGGTVYVAAGTYAELLKITKPLTLLGPNAGIDGTTGTRNPEALITFPEGDNSKLSLIDAESNDINVNGFSFTNNQIENTYSGGWDLILVGENIEFVNNRVISQAQRKIAFKIQGPFTDINDPNNHYAGAIVKNNYFESMNTSWSSVIIQCIGATVQDNTMIGGSNGIQIQPYNNTVGGLVSHNDVSGYLMSIWHNYQIDGNGLWIYEYNNVSAPIPPITYYHYGAVGTWGGIRVQSHTPNIEVKYNTFNGENDDYTLDTDNSLERTSLGVYYYSGLYPESQINVHDNEFVNVDQNVDNQTAALGNLDIVFEKNTFEKSAYIENGYLIYTSIQDAIDAAADGDTILVGPGTYVETVTVNKDITLDGATDPFGSTPAVVQGLITISAQGATVQDLKVTPGSVVGQVAAVSVYASNTTVSGNLIDGMVGDNTATIKGIHVYGGSTTALGNITISGNTVKNISNPGTLVKGTDGIQIQGNLIGVNVSNNIISAISSQGWAYGIEVTPSGANPTLPPQDVVVTGNTISNVTAVTYPGVALSIDQYNDANTADASKVTAELNRFNALPVVNKDSAHSLLAEKNWWGSAAGPTAAQIVGKATYIPWCLTAQCVAPYGYPEFNGDVSGTFTTSETGAVSGTLTGEYNVTVTGQVSGYVNNNATFTGTVTGDIVGDITASINEMGVGTLAGTVTNTGAILPVRILGIFPQTGTKGDFIGEVITGEVTDLAESMSITTPGDVSTVFAGGTLQLGVVIDPATAQYGQWSIWEPAGTDTGSTISSTGLLSAGTPGTITVIAKALDGSLLDATKSITIEPALVSITPVDPVVCGNTTTTTIDINVAGIPTATPLQGYQFRLNFDETKTNVANLATDIVNGGFILNGGYLVATWIDETTGAISTTPTGILDIGYTQYTPSASFGDGKLASITLTHLGVPGDIDFTLTNVVLSSRDGIVIPSEASATATTLTLSPAVLNTTVDPDAGYCDLDSAVLAASAGDTLQLQADIAIPTTVSVNKSLTLDLNGKVATYSPTDNSFALNVDGATTTLTLVDGVSPSTGKILVVDADADGKLDGRGIEVTNGGTLLFNSGTIEAPYAGVYLMENAEMTLNGGTIDSFYGVVTRKPGASLTVTTGTITADGFAISGNGSAGQAPTTILINGGTITSTATAIYHPQDGTLTINGGTISGNNGIEMKSGNLVVTGGTILGTGAFADPLPNDDGSTNTGDAILLNGRNVYTGDITVTISGTPTITSTNAYALREYVGTDQDLKTSSVVISGGAFTGGTGKEAVTFSPEFRAAELAGTANLALLPGGLFNTDPDYFVFVPYGTKLNTVTGMYEVVGISLNVTDFYYNNNGILRGVSTDFTVTNFVFAEATSVTVELFSGAGTTESPWALQQTNVLKTPGNHNTTVLTSSFDYFGTYVSNSWTNTHADGYDKTIAPTRVEVTVVLPGGTLIESSTTLIGTRADILPGVDGLVTLQGILTPKADVKITLTAGSVVRDTLSTALSDINYGFTGVETLTYTFTTSQARYLNVTADSGKIFLVDRDRTLNPLRLFGGDVNGDNQIQVTDASLVGEAWGSTVDSAANINYDGIVNIQDLALVGGNFGLTSATAYSGWIPFTTP